FQGAFVFEAFEVEEDLHEGILENVFGLKICAGIPLAHGQHLACVRLVQQLLGVPFAGHSPLNEVCLGRISGFENLQRRGMLVTSKVRVKLTCKGCMVEEEKESFSGFSLERRAQLPKSKYPNVPLTG